MATEVLSNRDLVRNLLSQSTEASHILTASKSIRDAQQPCTSLYERWAERGCPRQAEGNELSCLQSIGGLESAFCQGSFEYTILQDGWPMTLKDQAPATVATKVLDLLKRPPNANLVTNLSLILGTTTLRLQLGGANTLTTTNQGWRRRGIQCRPTDEQVRKLLQSILTRTGTVELPCPEGSRAGVNVQVPRSIHIHMARWDELMEQEWLLLYGQRS